jgi:hypothetical protein
MVPPDPAAPVAEAVAEESSDEPEVVEAQESSEER